MKRLIISLYRWFYEKLLRPFMFRSSAQAAHHQMLQLLKFADALPPLCALLAIIHRLTSDQQPVQVGGVALPHPLILAAGLVKGEGFATEAEALAAVTSGHNIIPGWRSIPRLVGLVEFGSFTRHPRLGNPGVVVWRDEPNQSTQNRVGLRNPGAIAAAAFLSQYWDKLPPIFGINIATSPGVTDSQQEAQEVVEALAAFLEQDICPTWFTLNLSCPNTEDDPGCRQTAAQAHAVCQAVTDYLRATDLKIPLWVKISPELAPQQYQTLMQVFHETGVRAVIATNTLPRPTPTPPEVIAGVGGQRLHPAALETVRCLQAIKQQHGYAIDVIGCGGVLDGISYQAFVNLGASVVQYWSALIYRGPLAAAVIESEFQHGHHPSPSRPRVTPN